MKGSHDLLVIPDMNAGRETRPVVLGVITTEGKDQGPRNPPERRTVIMKQDRGKGLDQRKIAPGHWRIEGYDVYPWSCWEGTHTSTGAPVKKDGATVFDARNITEARRWIRQQISNTAPECTCGALELEGCACGLATPTDDL